MVSRQHQFQQDELKLGDDIEGDYKAIANEDRIRNVAKLLMSIGDSLESRTIIDYNRQEEDRELRSKSDRSSRFYRFVDDVDTILEWLEHAGRNMFSNLKKHETVLRGFFHMTEIASQAKIFEILEFACSFLDVASDPFPAKREYVVKCLKDVEKQREKIVQLGEQASQILRDIITSEGEEVDLLKGKQFDNVVREARVEIDSCRRRLAGAEATLIELLTKMNTLKWFSRSVRATGWLLSSYYFYQKYQESTISLPIFVGGSAVAGATLLALFPSRVYSFHESLSKLASDHRLLREQLDDLHLNLNSSKDHIDGLKKKHRRKTT